MLQPSPEGLAYQLAHIHDNRIKDVMISHSFCATIAVSFVLLRFLARRMCRAKVGPDDFMSVFALVLAIGEITAGLLGLRYGGGKHMITVHDPATFAKYIIAIEFLYNPAIAAVKFSCLLLYRRIFPGRIFRICLWSVGGLIALYTVAQILLVVLQCIPISGFWDPTIKAKCINPFPGPLAIAVLNVFTDVLILALPLPLLWRLQLPRTQRLQLMGIFLLGGFVCIVSIYRATKIRLLSMNDMSWTNVDPCIWSVVEVCGGIVDACLPTLRPLWAAAFNPCSSVNSPPRPSYRHGIDPRKGPRQERVVNIAELSNV